MSNSSTCRWVRTTSSRPIRASTSSNARTLEERARTYLPVSLHVTGTRFRAIPFWYNPTAVSRSTATKCLRCPTSCSWANRRTPCPCATRTRAVCSTSGRTRKSSPHQRSSRCPSRSRSPASIHENDLARAERPIGVDRLRCALCLDRSRGHGRAGCRCQRRSPSTERHTTRKSQQWPDRCRRGRAECLLHSARGCEHSRVCRPRRIGGRPAQGHHRVRWKHHSGKHHLGSRRRKLFPADVPGVRVAEFSTWRASELQAYLQPDQFLRALRR